MTYTLAEFFNNCLAMNGEYDLVGGTSVTLKGRTNFFIVVKKEFDPCHVPSSHFTPYPIGMVPTYGLITKTISFIVDKYKLADDKWNDQSDPRSLFLNDKFELIITNTCKGLTNFNNVDLTDVELELVKIVKEYIENRSKNDTGIFDRPFDKSKTYTKPSKLGLFMRYFHWLFPFIYLTKGGGVFSKNMTIKQLEEMHAFLGVSNTLEIPPNIYTWYCNRKSEEKN